MSELSMSETQIRNTLEAALLAAGKSLTLAELSLLFDEASRPDAAGIRAGLEALAREYEGRALELQETGAGFRVQVGREYTGTLARLWPERPQRYSRALLETLALIAYRQPITRAEIEAVRGVAVNPNITRTLLERLWIRVVGHRDLPGRPELLGTTRDFLEYFGLKSLDELPPLADLRSFGELDPQLELSVAAGGEQLGVDESLSETGGLEEDGVVDGDAAADAEAAEAADAADADEYSASTHRSTVLVAGPPDDMA
jgi:segregation and condensation protein B